MADKPQQLILDALSRAAADPGGIPLHGSKGLPGLFAATAPGRQAAQRCKEEGYLRVVRTETRGKTVQEICTLTDKGLTLLLAQLSPRQVLEDLVRTLESRQVQVGELTAAAHQIQSSLEALQALAAKALAQVGSSGQAVGPLPSANGSETWKSTLLSYLAQRKPEGADADCPLPELYRQTQTAAPHRTIGQFHDGLRQLHEQGQIYLHPWTGPLYEIPEPSLALLIGHDIVYYASLR
ncbi:MAG: hypothetical protein JO112_02305 [Planctomycetes bacterium]|nr:hypothetical protein [Planctomycetota bacterium]